MTHCSRRLRALPSVIVLAVCLGAPIAGAEPERFAGRTLIDALGLLQQRGLPIVYSTAVVTSTMRVLREPLASDARRILDELLHPHALEAKRGPGGVLQIVRTRRHVTHRAEREIRTATTPPTSPDGAAQVDPGLAAPIYDETVVVTAPPHEWEHRDVATESTLSNEELRARSSVLASDPLAAMHTSPRVAETSDFRSDFSLRGSGSRHLALIVEGIAASNLQHTVYGAGESAMLAMITPAVVDRATVQVGAHPRRFTDALGGQVVLAIREGSRTGTKVSGTIAGIAAALTAEGPLGTAGRGSWLVSGRQSFLDWPTTSFATEYGGMGFGFRDVQAKTVYDVSAAQQVSLTAVAGHSLADLSDAVGPGGLFEGRHRASLVTIGWRSTLTNALVLQQRAHVLSHDLRNTDRAGATLLTGRERRLGYRADIIRVWPTVTMETGGQVVRADGSRAEAGFDARAVQLFERAAFAHATWLAWPGVTISPGMRVADSGLARRLSISRWISAEWRARFGWTLSASAGLGHQLPTSASALVSAPGLLPVERARYLDFTVERDLLPTVRLQATWFDRSERDVFDAYRNQNSLAGESRGAELSIDRSAPRGWSGSVAYSFGRTRYTDAQTGEHFWGDFDQRHSVNAFTSYKFSQTTLAAAFRSGSSFPIAGHFTARDGLLFVGERRNEVRRRPYARLDLQAGRSFSIGARELTLFVEMLNVLNRTNDGPANGSILPTGQAVGFTEKLLPRFLAAGLRVDFE